VTDVRELFNDLADAPMPPSPFDADQVFEAGTRRRRRRRRLLPVAGVAAVVALVVAVAVTTVGENRQPVVAGSGPPAQNDARPDPANPVGAIQWAGAVDPSHLYLAYLHCSAALCTKDAFDLFGSDDGGRTWTKRTASLRPARLQVAGAGRLLAYSGQRYVASDDGGRTWTSLTLLSGTQSGVEDGQIVVCRPVDSTSSCQLYIVDVHRLRMTLLAAQPPIDVGFDGVHDVGGRLWATGIDPGSGRAAVATSDDRGRSWTPHAFDGPPRCSQAPCFAPEVATIDGRTVYVTVNPVGASVQVVYRFDSGGWRRVDRGQVPLGAASSWSFVTADGAHVICAYAAARDNAPTGCSYWMLGADGAYRPTTLDGLPASAYPVERTPDGWFYTHSAGQTQGLYGSTDGRHWSLVTK
jgi:hypothetical protein